MPLNNLYSINSHKNKIYYLLNFCFLWGLNPQNPAFTAKFFVKYLNTMYIKINYYTKIIIQTDFEMKD